VPDRVLQRAALSLAVISSFVTPVMASAVNLALPALGADLGLTAVTLSWVQTSYLLSTAVFVLPAGRLADIHGRKRVFVWGMAVFGLASLLASLAPGAALIMTARVVQGLGSAMIFATGMAILSAAFPPGQRGRAMGVAVASIYIGLSLGPLLGGALTQHLGWRSVFALGAPFSALALWVALGRLKAEWAEAAGESFDLAGSLIYGLGLVAIIEGLALLPSPLGLGLIAVGLGLLLAFAWWEGRAPAPVFHMHLLRRNRPFALSCLAAMINYAATFAVTFLLSLYLQQVKGLSPQQAGLVLAVQPMMMALFSPLAGRLSDRVQPRIVASLGMGLTALGLSALSLLRADSGLGYITLCLVINGVGFGVFSSPNMNAIMSSVEQRYYGIASGAVASMRILGQMTSMGVATSMLAVYVGHVRLAASNQAGLLASLQAAFVIFAALCVAGMFASLSRGKLPGGGE